MSELPVFFATTDGQTRRIAEAFAEHARSLGVDSHAIDVTSAQARDFSWARARGVVFAAPLRVGAHQREAGDFVRRNLAELNARPSLFLSISLSISSICRTRSMPRAPSRRPSRLNWDGGPGESSASRDAWPTRGTGC